MWYQDWAQTPEIDVSLLQSVVDHGALPMLTWEPWDHTGGPVQPAFQPARIRDGAFDPYVRSAAAILASYGGPLLLRWAHEMNGHWYPWGNGSRDGTAADYVAAWRHLHEIFTAEGATNVGWVWCPNVLEGCVDFAPWYPGGAYVDWLALDGYNWGGWGRWRSFERLFLESWRRLTALGTQPAMVAETGCAEQGGNKGRWIREALAHVVPTKLPRARAVVWFNQNKERDWRIESSLRSQRAFADAVAGAPYRVS
jgi:beta-mannanase